VKMVKAVKLAGASRAARLTRLGLPNNHNQSLLS
jgi:hypothetical protein